VCGMSQEMKDIEMLWAKYAVMMLTVSRNA
jgi:hypothetical protein